MQDYMEEMKLKGGLKSIICHKGCFDKFNRIDYYEVVMLESVWIFTSKINPLDYWDCLFLNVFKKGCNWYNGQVL